MKNLQIPIKPELLEQFNNELDKSNCNSKGEFLSTLLNKAINKETPTDQAPETQLKNDVSNSENPALRLRILELESEIKGYKKLFVECDQYIKDHAQFIDDYQKQMENSVLLQFSEKQLEIITKCYKDTTDLETSIKNTLYDLMTQTYEVKQNFLNEALNGKIMKYLYEYFGYSREEFNEAFSEFSKKNAAEIPTAEQD